MCIPCDHGVGLPAMSGARRMPRSSLRPAPPSGPLLPQATLLPQAQSIHSHHPGLLRPTVSSSRLTSHLTDLHDPITRKETEPASMLVATCWTRQSSSRMLNWV